MSSTLVLVPVRVRTSDGDAFFLKPSKRGKPVQLGNDIPNRWLTLPAGTKFELCAKFEKTDTFMVAIEEKGKAPQGIILRRMSFDKLVAASEAIPAADAGVNEVSVTPEAPAVQVNDETTACLDENLTAAVAA